MSLLISFVAVVDRWPLCNVHFNRIYLSALLMWKDKGTAWRDAKFAIALGRKSIPFICFKKDIVRKRQTLSGLLSGGVKQVSGVAQVKKVEYLFYSIILLVLTLKKFSLTLINSRLIIYEIDVDQKRIYLATLNAPNDDKPSFNSSLVIYMILRVRT